MRFFNKKTFLYFFIALLCVGQVIIYFRIEWEACALNYAFKRLSVAGQARFCRRGAEGGSIEAQYRLGLFYMGGRGIQKDLNKALYWFEKAATQGHEGAQLYGSLACFSLMEKSFGTCPYGLGAGSSEVADCLYAKKAFLFASMATEQGNLDAKAALGYLYVLGWGVEKNISYGLELLRSADLDGSPLACGCLSNMYKIGLVVKQDTAMAGELLVRKDYLEKAEPKVRVYGSWNRWNRRIVRLRRWLYGMIH